jgi:hypothetical protein
MLRGKSVGKLLLSPRLPQLSRFCFSCRWTLGAMARRALLLEQAAFRVFGVVGFGPEFARRQRLDF